MPPKNPVPKPSPSPSAEAAPEVPEWAKKILEGNGSTGGPNDVFTNAPNAGLVVGNGGMFDTEVKGQKDPELKISDVMWRFYRWSDEQVRRLAAKLAKAGFEVTEGSSRDVVWQNLYDVLMEAARRRQALGDKAPTVDQILQGYMKNPVSDIAAAQAKPESYTETSPNLTDPSSAKALLDEVLAKELGRGPTPAEKAAFLAALNTAEKANPNKVTYRLDKATGQYLHRTTSGGINTEEFASQWVEDDETRAKERGDFQMAGTYFDALLSAIQSPVQ